MPKISSYTSVTPSLTDKLIGTDANDNLSTKNFTIGSIVSLLGSATLELTQSSPNNVSFGNNDLTKVSFGAAVSGSNVSLDAAGDLTFSTAGTYHIDININKAVQASSAGMKQMLFGIFKGSTQIRHTISDSQYYPNNATVSNGGELINIDFLYTAAAGDVLSLKVRAMSTDLRFSPQASGGGLAIVPSTAITVHKF